MKNRVTSILSNSLNDSNKSNKDESNVRVRVIRAYLAGYSDAVEIVKRSLQMGLYGDGVNTFEVAAWEGDNGEWIKLSPYNDVLAHQSIDRVHEVINDISNGIIKQYETI